MVLPLQTVLALGFALAAPSGVYFEQTTVTRERGRPLGPGVVSRVWCSGKRMRMETGSAAGGPALILRFDADLAYRLDPESKTATVLDLGRLRARAQMDLSTAGDLMGAEEGARTAPLPTPRTIAGHACRGFRITADSTVLEVWVAESVPAGIADFADFLEWSGADKALASFMSEIRRLPGFPLETRSRVTLLGNVHETVSMVTKVEVHPQPESLFEPPRGYHVVAEAPEP